MSIGALDAALAYGRAAGILPSRQAGSPIGSQAGLLSGPLPPPGMEEASGAQAGTGAFGRMIEEAVTGAAATMRTAEAASAKQVAGRGDLIDVVTAIGAAETALETVVAVRDRVVSAYTEIMRMQI